MRAALKKMTSTSSLAVKASSCLSTEGMEDRLARSMGRVETLTLLEDLDTNGASSLERRWVLRARRMMWFMPLEANFAATF
jgi:hypothetical protein